MTASKVLAHIIASVFVATHIIVFLALLAHILRGY